MIRLVALAALLLAPQTSVSSIQPLPASVRAELTGEFWHPGCPVALSQLRLLTVSYWGFDGQAHDGQLVVNGRSAAPLSRVFRRLYELRFPIRHLALADAYGPAAGRPADGDVTG